MVKVIMHGCNGHMGQVITQLVEKDPEIEIVAGNDQFESLDEEFEDLLHASDDVRVRCSDCGSEYTKRELLDNNAAIIDNAVDELAQDAIKELEKELKKAMKKWKF